MTTSADYIVPAFKAELLATAETDARGLRELLRTDATAQAAYTLDPNAFLLGAAVHGMDSHWPDAWGPAALFDCYHAALTAAFAVEVTG